MPLRAIIVRADGVLADTREVERNALNHVVEDAGFNWRCDRAAFNALSSSTTDRSVIAKLVPILLKAERHAADTGKLIDIMCRRFATLVDEKLTRGEVDLKPGVRDVLSMARQEGIKLGIVSAIPAATLQSMIGRLVGLSSGGMFSVTDVIEPKAPSRVISSAYDRVLAQLNVPARDVLIIESTPEGLQGANALGCKTMVLTYPGAQTENLESAVFVATDILSLIAGDHVKPVAPLSRNHREALLQALERLHAGYTDFSSPLERSVVMKVRDILDTKGATVKTIRPDETVVNLASRLRSERIGVMVVMGTAGTLDGIISERDLAHGIAEHGAGVAYLKASDLMTRSVITCSPDDTVSGISKVMTQKRIRHLPVVDGGQLVGLVSIGDVLKYRLEEIQLEANVLRDYAIARG